MSAADVRWRIIGPSNDWDTTTQNWEPVGGGAAQTFTNGDTVTFFGGGETITITTAVQTNSITFSGGIGYTITGGSSISDAGSGTVTVTSSAGVTNTISADIGSAVSIEGTGILTLSGTVTGAVAVSSGASLVSTGTTGAITNDGAVTLNGGTKASLTQTAPAATTTINGSTTLTGGFTNTLGTLTVNAATTLGANSTNAGTLDVNAAVLGGQQITNTGTTTIAADLSGLYVQNAGAATTTIDISATLTGGFTNTMGTLTVNAAMTLGANSSNAGTLDVNADILGAQTITNTGIITVDASLAGITLQNGVGGTVTLDSGTIGSVASNGGTFNLDGGTVASLTGTSGTSTITDGAVTGTTTLDGGTIIVDQTTADAARELQGATTINGGELRLLDGQVAGVTMTGGAASTALLTGVATLDSLIANGGTIRPGSGGIGTLNVTNAVAFNDGSTFDVELNPAGNTDLLAVGGAVTIAATGTTLNITGLGANYPDVSPDYTILTATGGITGEFETVQDNLPDLDFTPTYNANSIVLTYMASADESPKEVVGASVTAVSGATTSYTQGLTGRTQSLGTPGFDRMGDTFEALGYAPTQTYSARWMDHVEEEQPAHTPDRGWGLWSSLEGGDLSVDASGTIAGMDATTAGLTAGLEYRGYLPADSLISTVFGAAAGYSVTSTDSGTSSAEAQNYQIGLYGGVRIGGTTLSGALAYATHDLEIDRVIPLGGGGTSSALGQTDGHSIAANVELLHRLFDSETETADGEYSTSWFGPVATADLLFSSQDAYTETGAGVLNLTVNETETEQAILGLGLAAGTRFGDGNGAFELTGRLMWQHLAGDQQVASTSFLQATPTTTFATQSAPLGRDRLALELSAALQLNEQLNISLAYGGHLSEQDHGHRGSIELAVTF